MAKEGDDWTKGPMHEEGIEVAPTPLNQVKCPKCRYVQDTANHKLKAKVGYGNLTCQRCRSVSKASQWFCECDTEWHRCNLHVHKELIKSESVKADILKRSVECSVRGTSCTHSKRMRTEWHELAISESAPQLVTIRIDGGRFPKLAAKFLRLTLHAKGLHHVEAAEPT